MKHWTMLFALVGLLGLAACSSGEAATTDTGAGGAKADTNSAESGSNTLELITDDSDLSPLSQLALGTLQLEGTDQAVSEDQAATLLPLWQALQTLSTSDTTAAAELDAVVRQVQRSMTAGQIQAMNDMDLSADKLAEMLENGELGFGRGMGAGGGRGNGTGSGGNAGGMAGGGPGGMGFPPGGMPGGGPGGYLGGVTQDQMATRQAEFANMDPAELQEQMLLGSVVRLLQTKTGEMPARPGGGAFDAIFTAVSEATGLSMEEIQAQMAEGETMAQVIEEAGGDVEAVRAAAIAAIEALPDVGDLDAAQMVDDWFSRTMQPPPMETPAP